MKRKLLLLIAICFSLTAVAQTTFIPDNGLEYRLQQLGLDSGPLDNMVLTGNIDDLEDFNFGNFNVTDITGLQDFVSLKDLRVAGEIADLSPIENLTALEELTIRDVTDISIDLSALVNLSFVSVSRSSITTLDFTNNVNLTEVSIQEMTLESLVFGNNPLLEDAYINDVDVPQLDFSSCTALRTLSVNQNSTLINLNVTQNTLLETIEFDDNSVLPYIDLSANTALNSVRAQDNTLLETIFIKSGNNTNIGQTFRVKDNPSLTCVEVDDVAWSNTYWGFPTNYFTGFSLNCSPSNDDCTQAIQIQLAETTSGTTQNATSSTNTPDCQASGISILDIWYQFQVPASGDITINIDALPLIAKIALYESCTDAQPIYCAEGELSVENLTPNATYYVQVWLESNAATRNQAAANADGGFILNIQDTSTLSTNDLESDTSPISIYPNPAKDIVTIKTQQSINEVSIHNLSGQHILTKNKVLANETTLRLNHLHTGVYLIQIKTNDAIQTKKLIIN